MNFKLDKYQKARGGYSRILILSCRVCGNKVAEYQKDGAGNLRRLYLDRIVSPNKLVNLEKKSLMSIDQLRCSKCKEDLGTPYIYKKENRKAFKLYQDSLIKKVTKLKN
ncbi:hypothetical protein J4416_01975 [Candidatus Pacearchaeota archaeon]|nr:hypothetical protein [Candidatus Pacearchaeota archaeon]